MCRRAIIAQSAGQRGPEHRLPFVVRGVPDDRVRLGVRNVRELLGAADDDEVVGSAGHGEPALVEREGARRRRRPRPAPPRGDGCPEPGVVEDQRGDVLLVDQRAARHVAEVERAEVAAGELRVHQGLEPGLDADLPERPVPQLAELGHADAEDRDVAHQLPPMWILPRNFA